MTPDQNFLENVVSTPAVQRTDGRRIIMPDETSTLTQNNIRATNSASRIPTRTVAKTLYLTPDQNFLEEFVSTPGVQGIDRCRIIMSGATSKLTQTSQTAHQTPRGFT